MAPFIHKDLRSLGIELRADNRLRLPNGTIGYLDVEPDETETVEFSVKNVSDVVITVDNISLDISDEYQIVGESGFSFPFTLDSDESFDFEISVFSELEAEEIIDFLTIASSVAGAPLTFRLLVACVDTSVSADSDSDSDTPPPAESAGLIVFGQFDRVGYIESDPIYGLSYPSMLKVTNDFLTRDQTFRTNIGLGFTTLASGALYTAVQLEIDGPVFFGGPYTSFNGVASNRPVHALNIDGTENASINANIGQCTGSKFTHSLVRHQNKVLAGGLFPAYAGGIKLNLIRFETTGAVDGTFTGPAITSSTQRIRKILVNSDDTLIISGNFTTINGATRNRITKLASDGSEDASFYTALVAWGTFAGFNSDVLDFVHLADGSWIFVGAFTSLNGALASRIVKLNSDLTIDTTFEANVGNDNVSSSLRASNAELRGITICPDGDLLIFGDMTTWKGAFRRTVTKISPAGVEDVTFATNVGIDNPTPWAQSVAAYSAHMLENVILFGFQGGVFSAASRGLIALNLDGTVNTALMLEIGIGATSEILAETSSSVRGFVELL